MRLFKLICSWRASRLMKKDGWKSLLIHHEVWVGLVVVVLCVWCMQSLKPTGISHVDTAFDVLSIISVICILFAFIDVIIGADDYYKLVSKEKGQEVFSRQIYLYKRKHDTYKMTTVNYSSRDSYYGTSKSKLLIGRYTLLTYGKAKLFLFTLVEDPTCWYCLCDTASGEQKLGKRIGETAFIRDGHYFNKKIVSILNGAEFAVYHADKCFFDHVNVVDKTGKNALFANQYIVLKDGGQYKVLGLYFSDKKVLPHVAEEENLSFSFLTSPSKVSLTGHNGIYREA